MHWIIQCPRCKWEMYIDFERDDNINNHYVRVLNDQMDHEEGFYACGACHRELSDDDRQGGYWKAKFPERKRRGYWINQLMVPWVSAVKVLQQENTMPIDVFHNFVLGKPYQASEFVIDRNAILQANEPGLALKSDVIIGCDSGKVKHWVIGNPDGIFGYGTATEWSEIEDMINLYNATAVIDALPDFTIPEYLARKYPGQVFVHYYKHDTTSIKVTQKKEGEEFGVLQSDRTKLFDLMAGKITSKQTRFFQEPEALEKKNGIISHFENMYRAIVEDKKGIKRAVWETKVGKPDHLAHAAAYYTVGLSLALMIGEAGGVKSQSPAPKKRTSYAVNAETQSAPVAAVLGMPLETLVERSLARNKRKRVQ
jgi:hypothetical protein